MPHSRTSVCKVQGSLQTALHVYFQGQKFENIHEIWVTKGYKTNKRKEMPVDRKNSKNERRKINKKWITACLPITESLLES